jgi:hypothetical protein
MQQKVKSTRRQFVLRMSSLAGASTMVACGGDSASEVLDQAASVGGTTPPPAASPPAPAPSGTGATLAPAPAGSTPAPAPLPAPTPAQSPTPPPGPTPAPTGARQFVLIGAASGNVPFTTGFALARGEFPAGQSVRTSLPTAQAVIKTTWPDGSAKYAVISGVATLTKEVPTVVSVSPGSATTDSALSTVALRNTGVTAAIDCGTFGSVSWSGADWQAPNATWIEGPAMSSWIYRKAVGGDAHLVAWLEVRYYVGGEVELLPWIENGYLRVAGPTVKSAQFQFSIDGAQRFNEAITLFNHTRTPLISGAALAHWRATDPGVMALPDATYLQSTRLVPTYFASTPASAAVVTGLPATYTPLQQGSFPLAMGSAGYHSSIGLLPQWDVLYLTAQSNTVWSALQRNAYSAGRYGIHFRDETTLRPPRLSQYPTLVLDSTSGVKGTGASTTNSYTPAATGGQPPAYNNTHCPALGFFAYLLTGRFYHLETTQFQATVHAIKTSDAPRQGIKGIMRTDDGAHTERGAAWSLRTLAQALAIAPDGDVLQGELKNSFEANVDYLHARYVAKPNNPQGWVTPYADYTAGDNVLRGSTWMQDFFTAAFGMAMNLGLPLSAASSQKLSEFFTWKAHSVVGRLGTAADDSYLYRDAVPYTIAQAPADKPDFAGGTGPWYPTWGAVYAATHATSSPGPRVEGDLRGGDFPAATGYWGNLQPALAFAVEHNIPGAREAYGRMTAAANWQTLVTAFNQAPVWSVRPRR